MKITKNSTTILTIDKKIKRGPNAGITYPAINPVTSVDTLHKFYGEDTIKKILLRFLNPAFQWAYLDACEDLTTGQKIKFSEKSFTETVINIFNRSLTISDLTELIFEAIDDGNLENARALKLELEARKERRKRE